jgi:16S rRNA (adenine1518-N6/adenine1519-N6)-dimethyltransferase
VRLKKRYGQHFLKDRNVIRRIADALPITSDDVVVEIGPGGGALTEELLARNPKALYAIEIDPDWVNYLKERFKDRITVFNADATTFDFSQLGRGLKFFGNLPYNVSTAIIRNLLNHRSAFSGGVFMVQKEVAGRLTATGGKEFGYLPALLQRFFTVKPLFDVPPGAFKPPPKVWSTVVKLEPKEPELSDEELLPFENFLKMAFSHRRKKLKKNIPVKGELPPHLQPLLEKRAEELTGEQLLELFRALKRQ